MSRQIAWLVLMFIVVALALPVAPARAGTQRWSAWMYDSEHGQLLLLTEPMHGNAQSLQLPLPAGFNAYSRNVAISHDWHYIAYDVENTAAGTKALLVYNRDTNQLVLTFPIPGNQLSLDFGASEDIFNEAGTSIAFAYSINQQGWEIKALNLANPSGVPTLRHDTPAVKTLGIGADFLLPVIRLYQANQVNFSMIRLATEGAPTYDNYVWDVTSGEVRKSDLFPTLDLDRYRPTGELIFGASDPRFASCGEACSPFWVFNALHVRVPGSPAFPFYTTPQLSLYHPIFIQNGERILVGGSAGNGQTRWLVVERSGGLVSFLPDGIDVDSVIGTQDGFLYMPAVVNPSGSPQLYEVNTRQGINPGQLVWTGTQGTQVHLVQTPSNQQGTGPFAPWAQLAAPSVLGPTVAPVNPGTLAVGRQAVINTTQGDKLRLRSGPGTSFAIITMLDKGTLVTLLEGPRSADGLTWWRVRTPGGVEGWVIEGINDSGTYIQTLVPA